jgi:hypothetical protein
MLVHSSQREKGAVFEKLLNEFKQTYAPLEDLEKKKAEVQNTITQNMGPFSSLVSATQSDAGKTQFYQ